MNHTSFIDSSNFDIASEGPIGQQQSFSHVEEIPSAGFNQLFLAERYGKKWFLKGLKKEFRQQPFYIELLRKELDIALSLDHPNIVKTFGWEQIPEAGPCIIMEYVDGETLKEAIEKGIIPSNKQRIIFQLLEAVTYFHSKQIVHRDLKPANIIITHNGKNVKVIDFGLADTDSYFILKQPAGTLRYISPEQQGGRCPDIKNDIYSIGRILEDMRLGWHYRGIIQHCLQPAAQRYENTTQLVSALQKAQKRTTRTLVSGMAFILILLLAYLTWQVMSIQQSIPKDQNYSSQFTALQQMTSDQINSTIPYFKNTTDKRVENAVKRAVGKVDKYILSTDIQQHLDTLNNIQYLDNQKYTQTALEVNQIIDEYCSSVKNDFNTRQNSDIYLQICYHVSENYFSKWSKKLISLSMSYQEYDTSSTIHK